MTALIEEVPSVAETPAVKQEVQEAVLAAPATVQDTSRTNGVASGISTATPVQSFVQQQPPQPQKIPTYEQPLPNEYRDSGGSRQDGAYQNIALNERSVRPSEMKDEG